MPVHDYTASVTELTNYLKDFSPVTVDRNTTKLPDNKLLDLLDFRIPINWQQQMHVQNFEPTARTLYGFQNFYKCLESTLEDLPVDNISLTTSPDKMKVLRNTIVTTTTTTTKEFRNTRYCMLHGHNPTHSTKQCSTLKREMEKVKKVAKMETATKNATNILA